MIDRAAVVLVTQPVSKLRVAHRTIEGDAQVIWRRRYALHASDLVRFGRTYPFWRNNQVTMRDQDITCEAKLRAVGNPAAALDMALDAGTRQVAQGVVTSVSPLRLRLASRRIGSGARIVLLHVHGQQIVELPSVEIKPQAGSFKLRNLPIGELTADAQTAVDGSLLWAPKVAAPLQPGDPVIVADASWFGKPLTSGAERKLKRHASCPANYDEDTYARLIAWRLEAARQKAQPAFVIFTDATLMTIAENRPASLPELLAIPGVGKVKSEHYGEAVLAILKA